MVDKETGLATLQDVALLAVNESRVGELGKAELEDE